MAFDPEEIQGDPMKFVGLFVTVLALVMVAGCVGYALGRRTSPPSDRVVAYREHARLMERAAKASAGGQHGLAEILAKAAKDVLDPNALDPERARSQKSQVFPPADGRERAGDGITD